MNMMPLGGLRRIDRKRIHPTSEKRNSANFVLTEFLEVSDIEGRLGTPIDSSLPLIV
jgi:hypothetical protein